MEISELDFDTDKFGLGRDMDHKERLVDYKVDLVAANALSGGFKVELEFGGGEPPKITSEVHIGMQNEHGSGTCVGVSRDAEGHVNKHLSLKINEGNTKFTFQGKEDEKGRITSKFHFDKMYEYNYEVGRGSDGPPCGAACDTKYEPDSFCGFDKK